MSEPMISIYVCMYRKEQWVGTGHVDMCICSTVEGEEERCCTYFMHMSIEHAFLPYIHTRRAE